MNEKLKDLQQLVTLARELSSTMYAIEQGLVDELENNALHNLEFLDYTNLDTLDLEMLESTQDIVSQNISETYQKLVQARLEFEKVCEMIEDFR